MNDGRKQQRCECCGNDYPNPLRITLDGSEHVFDCFECAIHTLAPTCGHCGCRIIGHGVDADGTFYCCAHCAEQAGHRGLKDHVEQT